MGSKKKKKMDKQMEMMKKAMEAMGGGFQTSDMQGMGDLQMPGMPGGGGKMGKRMEKMKMAMETMGGGFQMPSMQGMGGMGGLFDRSPYADFLDPKFTSELSRHVAARQIKRGISKTIEIARLNKEIQLTTSIAPPERVGQALNKEELKMTAQRLQDLGYYYERDPEKDEIEFTLAPTYIGLVGKASEEEQDSFQAAIKRFQRVHGFGPADCNGCIEPDDKTLKNLNSKLRTSLVSHSKGSMFHFEEREDDHLHPVLKEFLEDLHWIFKTGSSFRQDLKRGRRKSNEESLAVSNIAREITISHASRGYPGDGHKNINSKHYEALAIDVSSVNGKSVSDAPRELKLTPNVASHVHKAFREYFLGSPSENAKKVLAFFIGPVTAFAHTLEGLKVSGDKLPVKWRIVELDSPWHGDTENHQNHVHVAVERKL